MQFDRRDYIVWGVVVTSFVMFPLATVALWGVAFYNRDKIKRKATQLAVSWKLDDIKYKVNSLFNK